MVSISCLEAPRAIPFLDRHLEACRLRSAIQGHRSLLISGPQGIGKTALVAEVVSTLPERTRRSIVYLDRIVGLRPLVTSLLHDLYEKRDPLLVGLVRRERAGSDGFPRWLRAESTSRLKGSAYRACERTPYTVVLDHMPRLSFAAAKVVKELSRMRDTPVILVSRGDSKSELGPVEDLFWHPASRVLLGTLAEAQTRILLEASIRRLGLEQGLDLEPFRSEVLEFSGGVPGAIVTMVAMATDPRYQEGSRVKTELLHIDYLIGMRAAPGRIPEAASASAYE
jgi:AAA ATPase-like protein